MPRMEEIVSASKIIKEYCSVYDCNECLFYDTVEGTCGLYGTLPQNWNTEQYKRNMKNIERRTKDTQYEEMINATKVLGKYCSPEYCKNCPLGFVVDRNEHGYQIYACKFSRFTPQHLAESL